MEIQCNFLMWGVPAEDYDNHGYYDEFACVAFKTSDAITTGEALKSFGEPAGIDGDEYDYSYDYFGWSYTSYTA